MYNNVMRLIHTWHITTCLHTHMRHICTHKQTRHMNTVHTRGCVCGKHVAECGIQPCAVHSSMDLVSCASCSSTSNSLSMLGPYKRTPPAHTQRERRGHEGMDKRAMQRPSPLQCLACTHHGFRQLLIAFALQQEAQLNRETSGRTLD